MSRGHKGLRVAGLLAAAACGAGVPAGAWSADAQALLELAPREQVEFQPAAGQTLVIPYVLGAPGTPSLHLFTGDGDRIRTLSTHEPLKPGRHEFQWDGRDDRGEVVPDEAYHPVLECPCGLAEATRIDPRRDTGGEPVAGLQTRVSPDGTIMYRLSRPARTLVRIGVEQGPMLRALSNWAPRAAGAVRHAWDGYDASGEVRMLGLDGLRVLARAFALPEHTIITSGNAAIDYQSYRQARGWPPPAADLDAIRLERGGKALARESQLPVSLLQSPATELVILDELPVGPSGLAQVSGPVTFRVDMAEEDKWLMQQSLYEVAFFLDHRFVSEEETGYTPLSWRWLADAEPGVHVMTVNISGFWGQVGVDSVRFEIKGEEQRP